MVVHGTPLDRLVVVDNHSTDGTRDYLSTLPLGARIFNQHNLGCGTACPHQNTHRRNIRSQYPSNSALFATVLIVRRIAVRNLGSV